MMGERDAETRTPEGVPSGRPKAPRPLAMAAAGALSLVVFTTAGWVLRGLDRGQPAEPVAPQVTGDGIAGVRDQQHARGKLVFQVHCARCHGQDGRGNGPDAATLRQPPRDLTALPWRTDVTGESIRRTVIEGLPGTMMTGLAASLTTRELDAVVDFVLSIAPAATTGPAAAGDVASSLEQAGFTPFAANRAAPPLSVRDADGKTLTLDGLRGRPVLIVFWGTSCAPCLEELPELERLASRHGCEGLAVVPVCVDVSDAADARRVGADRAPGLPVYADPTGTAKLSYGVQALPTAVLVTPGGNLLGSAQGSVSWTASSVDRLIRVVLHRDGAP